MTDQEWDALSGGLIRTQTEAGQVARDTGRTLEELAEQLKAVSGV